MIGVVVVGGEGGEKSWKKSSLIGTEVGTENVISGLVVDGSEMIGCKVSAVATVSC